MIFPQAKYKFDLDAEVYEKLTKAYISICDQVLSVLNDPSSLENYQTMLLEKYESYFTDPKYLINWIFYDIGKTLIEEQKKLVATEIQQQPASIKPKSEL